MCSPGSPGRSLRYVLLFLESSLKLLHTIQQTRDEINLARRAGKTIGFVPTMGALHKGHITLVEMARKQCDFVVVSIFVNPTQFGPHEDLAKYPRTLDADSRKCENSGVDVIFAPAASEMYPEGFDSWIEVGGLTDVLEGAHRPGHFRGVTTVCMKLFNIIQPDFAFFGRKDYQQLAVITKMAQDLNLPLMIIPVDTVRESDGLAMSSRNVYLSHSEREAALVLSRSLGAIRKMLDSGERRVRTLQSAAENMIEAEPLARIDYVAIVDAKTLAPIEVIDRPAVMLLAVRIGATRLIDNKLLG
jgi:pantoate--beta-alanine ligase